ncbi:hypothetical protein [Sphingomonas hankookensis]|uniref:hypothetical protein n=1 Tax=Sphingomonas hankookensis TaxID=563996 RepID=UPI003D3020C1
MTQPLNHEAEMSADPGTPAYEAARLVFANELRRIAVTDPDSGYAEMADRLMGGEQYQLPSWVAMQVMARSTIAAEPFAHFQWNSGWSSWEQVVPEAAGQEGVIAAYRTPPPPSDLGNRCTDIADQVVPEYRDENQRQPGYSCTGVYGKRWQAAWDGACLALGGDPKEIVR